MNDTDGLAAETRQLLDAATQGDWKHLPPSEGGTIHRVVRLATDDDLSFHICRMEDTGYSGRASWDQRAADAALIAAAPRLLANWLAREDELIAADGEHYEAWKRDQAKWKADRDERDAERAGRERAEADVRQLRDLLTWDDGGTRWLGAVAGRLERDRCGDWATRIRKIRALLAEGAEDRGQTDG